MTIVTCLQLATPVTLPTANGDKLPFEAGEVLMIVFSDMDDATEYIICSAGGGLPFLWIARNHSHKIVEMELTSWQALRKSKLLKTSVTTTIGSQ